MNKQEIDPSQWVDRYGDRMFGYTQLRVKDAGAAEEIVQVTFFAALQSMHSFEGRSSEKSWLFGILKYKILDYFREVKKNRNFDLNTPDDSDPCQYDNTGLWKDIPQHWSLDPEKAAENQKLSQALAQCLDDLPDKLCKVFVLKKIEGLSAEEICKDFSIKPTNLWVILHRARNHLKICLEANWFDGKSQG